MKMFIKVKTGARENKVAKIDDCHFEISTTEAPEKGKANRAVIKILADYFKMPQAGVEILAGHASRQKIVNIDL